MKEFINMPTNKSNLEDRVSKFSDKLNVLKNDLVTFVEKSTNIPDSKKFSYKE
jgi:hypothetical protein